MRNAWLLSGMLSCLVLAGTGAARAQKNPATNQANAKTTTTRFVVPKPISLLLLVRTTMIALDHANKTGNYTVLRDIASPQFREVNSAARLGQIFSVLRAPAIDLSPTAVVTPELTQSPAVSADNQLKLVGHFPGQPNQINFTMQFRPIAGKWKLYGLSVALAPSKASPAKPATAKPKAAKSASTKPSATNKK